MTSEKWSNEKANAWYSQKPWLKGFNYVPSNAVNSTEMWQDETFVPAIIHRELKIASEIGFNSCRVFLQYIVWKDNPQGFISRLEEFLQIAAANNLTVMPVFFDDCNFAGKEPYLGKQDEPRHGVSNSQWTPCPGPTLALDPAEMPMLKEYLQSIMHRYASDKRILLWDMYNEPGNLEAKGSSLPLLEASFKWSREIDPSQPLTCAVWLLPYDSECDAVCLEESDIISFHDYNTYDITAKAITGLAVHGRPILCTEWLNRPGNNRIETHIPLFKANNVGIFNWGLINGRTQTNLAGYTIHGEPDPNPAEWQHDFFHGDYTPYSADEIAYMKDIFVNGK